MATILLAGDDAGLLEGLAQALAALGHHSTVVRSLADAREASHRLSPLVAVVDRSLVHGIHTLGLTMAAGGAAVLFGDAGSPAGVLAAAVRRTVLAELTLPLERNRLLALVQRVAERATLVGRRSRNTPPETSALR